MPLLPVLALCAVQFVDVLGGTVVITALPTMLTDLGASQSASSLIVTGYAMFFGGLLVLRARCGDRFGHRRVLLAGIVLFGLASPLAALAGSVPAVVVARCLQGAAAALSVPAALRLLTAVAADEATRRRSLALWSASGAAAGASGLLLGGLVTQWSSWRVIFWFTLVLAAGLAVTVRRAVPADRGSRGQALDVLGAALLTGAVMAWVVGAALLEFPRWRAVGVALVLLGVLLVPLLVAVERRQRVPLLPAAAVRDRNLRAGAVGSFLNTATTSSAVTLVTLHLQGTDRLSASAAGLLLLPFSLAVVAGAAVSAPALRRWRPRPVIALGLGLIAVGNLALLAFDGAPLAVPFCLALAGAGIGLSSVAATATGTDLPAALQGVASGVLNTAAQLGVAAILLVAVLFGDDSGPAAGAGPGWAGAGLLAVVGVAFFALRPQVDPLVDQRVETLTRSEH